ncbi:MAG: mannitol dehydrogenase family protein [Solirubrobacteraceae bacterium]
MNSARPLSNRTLHWHAARVAAPRYERGDLRPGVVHLSVGAFHRSHQAVYFDDLACAGRNDWGVIGVGLRRPAMREALAAQDGLYTVVSRGAAGDDARIVGVMTDYLLAPRQRSAVLAALTDPRTAVVTLTITADAYARPADPERRMSRREPSDAVEYLVLALDARRRAGTAPFTVISCDNIPANGEVARETVLAHAALRSPELAAWVADRCCFPNGMVDRITPRTTSEDRAFVAREFGIADRWPVMTEPFSQWIVEGRFCGRRPPLDEVGVQFVDDVTPYALMKTRLLNAGHCALGHVGSLLGYERADEAVADPLVRDYLTQLMEDEVTPLLPAVPGIDLAAYRASLLERLANPAIADRLDRLCRSASAKVPAHVVPSIAASRRRGRPCPLLTLAVAAWFRHLRGVDDGGRRLPPLDDPLSGRLRTLARAAGDDPRPLLAEHALFGDLGADPGFQASVRAASQTIARDGVRGALRAVVAPGAVMSP